MGKRLLVIDDEPQLLQALSAVLRRIGYEVATARGGREALVRLAETLPDLIVSDVRMPAWTATSLRATFALRPVPT